MRCRTDVSCRDALTTCSIAIATLASEYGVAAEKMQRALRVFVRSDGPLEGIARRLEPKGDGEVSMILILEGGATEVEVRLPGKFKVSPQICGAIKAVSGVIDVQAL